MLNVAAVIAGTGFLSANGQWPHAESNTAANRESETNKFFTLEIKFRAYDTVNKKTAALPKKCGGETELNKLLQTKGSV